MALNVASYAHSVSHHLVGLTEIGAMLGVTRQRAAQIVKQYDDFPDPEVTLSSGRVWSTRAVEAWIRLHPERPTGRPRS